MHLSLQVERFVPTKVICVRNKDKPRLNGDCKPALALKQDAHLQCTRDRSRVNWYKFVHHQRRANKVYAEAGRQVLCQMPDVLMNTQYPCKWWSTLKSTVFGSSSDSSLPPLICGGWWSGL